MIELYEHNKTAYQSAVLMLDEEGKAAVVHPTGTGKSFIGFKLCEDHPEANVCWLSPSAYIFATQQENLRKATGGYVPDNIRSCTYARLMQMTEEELSELSPAYIILDEFHRCGARCWGEGVQRLLSMYPDVPVLGLSATAIRYLDNQRDMADELFEGCIASEMTLGEAIARGILKSPKYVLSAYAYEKDLRRYERRVKRAKNSAVRDEAERYLQALRRALDKAEGLDVIFERHMDDRAGKYIVFCSGIEHMRQMESEVKVWLSGIDSEPYIYTVYSDDPAASDEFAAFKENGDDAHLRLLFCIDALNEGVHVDDISGVILLRPTVSPIIYKQQIGRALTAGSDRDVVIFDVVMNIDNLYSIDALEEELDEAVMYYNMTGENSFIVNDRFNVIDELMDCRRLFEKLNDTLTASWEKMYEQAESYYREHGDLEVPRRYRTEEGHALGNWIDIQRKVYRGKQDGVLGKERIARLEAIGMVWESREEKAWQRYFSAAESYSREHGDLLVPADYVTDSGVALGKWIGRLRNMRGSGGKSGFLTDTHIEELDSLGMVWDFAEYRWETYYAAAKRYAEKHGDLWVPFGYIDEQNVRLGEWLNNLRKNYRPETGEIRGVLLNADRVEKLTALGMIWESKYDLLWKKGYEQAERYYREHGDLSPEKTYVTEDGYRLGEWINNQRARYRSGKLEAERKGMLDTIGMVWEKEDPWEVRYALAKEYYENHGDLRVPVNYKAGGICLNKWINEQKQIYHGKREGQSLSEEQIRRLADIGMDWRSYSEIVWDSRYEEAKEYYEEHGTLRIARHTGAPEERALGNWLTVQRKNYRNGKLSSEQAEKLTAIGIDWGRKLPEALPRQISQTPTGSSRKTPAAIAFAAGGRPVQTLSTRTALTPNADDMAKGMGK